RVVVRTRDRSAIETDAAVLTVPLPLLYEIELPAASRERSQAAIDIGYGNVVKFLFRFRDKWWAKHDGKDLSDLAFLLTDAKVPTWWTQHPAPHAVLTGWYSGLKADGVAGLSEADLIDMGLESLAQVFGRPATELKAMLAGARAINWGIDEFARGAYSYVTPRTDAAQRVLNEPADGVFISGEALYTGVDRGTVEAALAHGEETAKRILAGT
ncbi:MAG: FAD-dependent oxidoreductase, partial [Alphaproteobacteria bacterium]|nr:FAD-dependent oxidoreductase [Alphaproteobacteria bacterium]